MSIEAIESSGLAAEVVPLFTASLEEAPATKDARAEYVRAFNQLGLIAIRLEEASKQYHKAIETMIACREELAAQGINVDELARQLQANFSSTSAINDYGHRA